MCYLEIKAVCNNLVQIDKSHLQTFDTFFMNLVCRNYGFKNLLFFTAIAAEDWKNLKSK